MRSGLTRGAALLALALARPASAAWLEAKTDHFVVYSEGSAQSVREFATRLERFDKGMRYLRNVPDRPSDRANPLTVYVVPDRDAIRRLCAGGRRGARQCANVAGFYQPRAGGSVAFTPRRSGDGSEWDLDSQTVLFHEYSHHFMFANYTAAYPAWFTEGFAEFNSTADFEKDGTIGFGKPALHRAYGLLRTNPLPLAAMLAADNRKLDADQREAIYGRGWLLTHYLMFSKERQGQLPAYIKALNEGKSSLDAAKSAFGDLKTLDRELNKYLLSSRMSYLRIDPKKVPVGKVTLRPLTAGEAATMPVRLRSDRGVDAQAAAAVVVDARRRALPFPNDPGAQLVLAEAEYDAGDDDLAEAAADRALATAPENREGLMYKGRARIRRLVKAKAADPAAWKEARGWFVKANRLEPDDAEPLLLFYDSFEQEGHKPTANAIVGLERAFELAPEDRGLRLRVARQYLLDDKTKEARLVLAPLAFDPHGGPDNPAAALIALIDRGDTAALRSQLTRMSADAEDDGDD